MPVVLGVVSNSKERQQRAWQRFVGGCGVLPCNVNVGLLRRLCVGEWGGAWETLSPAVNLVENELPGTVGGALCGPWDDWSREWSLPRWRWGQRGGEGAWAGLAGQTGPD